MLSTALGVQAQQRTGILRLKHELDSLYYVDQVYRAAMFADNKQHLVDSLAAAQHFPVAEASQRLIGLMLQTDSSDIQRVRAIIQRYGYPGRTLVGTPTNEAAFYVIQHSNRIAQYLPLIKRAAEQGELPFRLYAMMLDRQLMYQGQPQVYGTQGRSYSSGQPFIWPIQDPIHVNELRKKAGFDQTVEQNAQRMHITYQVLTLDEVHKMLGYQPQATQK
ncbi:hypothetical protein GCM10023172_15600 [Hymenobacter ginsengisoli]|uniref:DUF4919 domain-containing protein n=1 Tax=Hymenobacter ginsengisoli TaxID=1051626 RepID=A0ABP8Q6W5_9BACT